MRTIFHLVPLLALLPLAGYAADPVTIPAARLEDQIRGGLLGQIIGDLNGLKHEMRYIAEPGNVTSYVPELKDGAWTDDDTDIEWIYLAEMQRSGKILTPYARMPDLWKRHINRKIWCSHLYLRQLLDLGIAPTLTGSVHVNPWAEFNLSGQFVSESWGLISPGMPQTAARTGIHYTHVSVDGEPIQSTQLFAAMIATAFLTSDIDKILDAGIASIDPKSQMAQVVRDIRQWHREHPEDWRVTRRLLRDKYAIHGGQDMRDRNGVLLNGASTVAALLYGHGDFVETLRCAFNFGWDADNNAATSGTILGVIKGERWIRSQGWQLMDFFRNTSRDEMPMDETMTRYGDRLVALARQVIREHGGAKSGSAGQAVYTVRVESPANVEPLPDFARQKAELREEQLPLLELDLTHQATAVSRARAVYLALCLDLADELRASSPQAWAEGVRDLGAQAKLLQAIWFESDIPAGRAIRDKLVAAGVQAPAARLKFE